MVSLLIRIDTDTISACIPNYGNWWLLMPRRSQKARWVRLWMGSTDTVAGSDSIRRVTPPVAAYASGGGKGMHGKGIGRSVGQACFAYPDLGFISKTTRSSWTYVLLSRLEATSLAKASSTDHEKRSKGRGRPQQVSNPTR